jgi:hypothetical protein
VDVTAQDDFGARYGGLDLASVERRVSSKCVGDLFFHLGRRLEPGLLLDFYFFLLDFYFFGAALGKWEPCGSFL